MYDELVKELRDSAEWADRLALLMGRAEGDVHAPVMRKAADAIEELSKPQWIPVTERLPEKTEDVWVCQKYGDGFVWQTTDQYTTNNGGGWLSEVPFDDPTECCKVIAWMPLPEPYEVA